ncbi:MAG: anthranilate synthase component I family protein [Bacteroidota bacterium]
MNETLLGYQTAHFDVAEPALIKRQLLQWSTGFDCCCYLDNNTYSFYPYHSGECLLAVGIDRQIIRWPADCQPGQDAFDALKKLSVECGDWIFGGFSYDLKNDIEQLSSANFDGLGFPDYHFFVPRYVFELKLGKLYIHSKSEDPEIIFSQICQQKLSIQNAVPSGLALSPRMTKQQYLEAVSAIREDIIEGVIYEMNFCQEFYAQNCAIDPLPLFQSLNEMAKAPFSAYYKLGEQYLLCASPERFLKKEGRKLISQPIKGTIKRGASNAEDQVLRQQLSESQKDQAENVMIVDLVRNDLARSCFPGSVKVEELFGIYSFEQVHQMISTVVGELRPEVHFVDAIRNAFPMGSMTGAPKVMSMKLIEQYESTRRAWYSGAVGYIRPNGDFDFNVVIRSLLYNAARSYLSLQLGGAIVFDSVPELEYEECLLKAKAMQQLGIRLDSCS